MRQFVKTREKGGFAMSYRENGSLGGPLSRFYWCMGIVTRGGIYHFPDPSDLLGKGKEKVPTCFEGAFFGPVECFIFLSSHE